MAKVKFLRDFRGVASAEQFHLAASVADLPEWQVTMLLAEGVVVLITPTVETGPGVEAPGPAVAAKKTRKPRAKKAT